MAEWFDGAEISLKKQNASTINSIPVILVAISKPFWLAPLTS
jgi:hypothetical protein